MNNKKTNKNHTLNNNKCKTCRGLASLGDPNSRGITLIALIITIIVMIILVGITVNVALNGGLFETAQKAGKQTEKEADRETLQAGIIGAIDTETLEIPNKQELENNLPEPWTVDGTGPYTATSPNGNKFTVEKNGNILGESGGEQETDETLALLEKYFLGEDKTGRNMMGEVMDEGFTTFNPYEPTKEEKPEEKLEFLSYGAGRTRTEGDKYYVIYEFYVKYENIGYRVSAHIDLAQSGSQQSIITESVEKVYEQKGREGQDLGIVTGNAQYNGWTILYDNGNEVEAVAPDIVGENLALGSTDKTAQTPGDVDKNGTANENLDKAIYSYNNAVKTINDYCKGLPGLPTNNGVRSVGSNPSNPYAENTTPYESEDLKNWNEKYNKLGKSTDENYEEDVIRMSYHKKLNINKYYWLASRFVNADPGYVNVIVRSVDSYGYFGGSRLWRVYSGGSTSSNDPSYGVRPIIKVSI